jgi:hypothetical protein
LQRKYGRGIYSRTVPAGLFGPYPGEIYDDLSERLQCAVSEAMKRYAASKDKNIHKLMKYADQLRVKPVGISYGWKLLHALT